VIDSRSRRAELRYGTNALSRTAARPSIRLFRAVVATPIPSTIRSRRFQDIKAILITPQ